MKIPAVVVALILLASPAVGAGAGLTLVENGEARVGLRVEASATPQLAKATQDLLTYTQKVSGGKFDETDNPKGSICVGSAYAKDFGVDLSRLSVSGYVLKTKGSNLLIAGNTERGTANGIYGFLMDYLGIRWYGPGEMWEVVPKRNTIRIPRLNVRREPSFGFRVFSGIVSEAGQDWYRRSRLDSNPREMPYFGFGHSMARIFPLSKYAAEHPEYFAMDSKGNRPVQPSDIADVVIQPCFSNPDVAEIAAQAARDYFEQNPSLTTFPLCPNDGSLFCLCPECQKLDSPMRYSKVGGQTNTKAGWPSYSDSYFEFVRRVAEKVAKTNPGKYLGCYAYWNTELPPRRIKRLPENVVIALTQDTSQHHDPAYKAFDRENWLAWSKIAAHLSLYDYYGFGWMTPRYFPTLAAESLKFVHANKAIGVYNEVYPFYYMAAPQLYVTTQMLWSVDQDYRLILDGYFRDLYGPAAEEMKAFYDVLERYWMQRRSGYWFQGGKLSQEMRIANPKLLEEARDLLVKAKMKVIGPELERVLYVESQFRFSYSVVQAYARARRLVVARPETEADVADVIREIEATLGDMRVAEDTNRNVVATDPLHQHVYYAPGQRLERKLEKWRTHNEYALRRALARVEECCRSEMASDVGGLILDDLRMRLARDPIAQELGLAVSSLCTEDSVGGD